MTAARCAPARLFRMLPFVLCLAALLWAAPRPAAAVPDPMTPPRMVNDFAGLFAAPERENLEALVRDYQESVSVPIYIVTVRSLEGRDALAYATEIGNAWNIGSRDDENGIVILIKPNTAREQGATAIAVGNSMERVVDKKTADRIIQTLMIPRFRNSDFAGGTNRAVHALAAAIDAANGASPLPPAKEEEAASPVRQPAAPEASARAAAPGAQQQTLTQTGVIAVALAGIFVLFMGVLVATGHSRLAGKIILGLVAVIGAIFALAAVFGGKRGGGGGGTSGGGDTPFSGGGSSGTFGGRGGPFSGGGASGSW